MGKDLVLWKGLDLAAAIRILGQAGLHDPTNLDLEPRLQIQVLIDALCDLSMHDGLTGLVNPTFFHAALATELDRSTRTGRTCGLLVVDVDRFKLINDGYGHDAGDRVLRAVAAQLKRSLRSMDTAARAGGDEFAVILPECTPEDALTAATRIHEGVNPLAISIGDPIPAVTTSAGLVWTEPGATITAKVLMARADAQFYHAKRAGRMRLAHPALVHTRVSTAEHSALMARQPEEDSHAQ